jgi:ABC-type polar amino acid transport system ATPase subunit
MIDGKDVLSMSDAELLHFRRFDASMVFQKFALLPHRTVLANTTYGLSMQGVEVDEAEKRANHWLERVGLGGFENRFPAQLSGGMQQRVGLARALATDADILLMDEGILAGDADFVDKAVKRLEKLVDGSSIMILATHSEELLSKFCTKRVDLGLNAKFKVNSKKEFHIFCDDFDNSGTYDIILSSNYNGNLVPSRGRECSSQQMPFVKDKFPSYKAFAEASLVDVLGEENYEGAYHHQAEILESVFVENLGNGEFKIKKLPISVQISPIMDFEFIDIDNNNSKEVIIVGNHYYPEVETVRYDASYGSILSYEGKEFVSISPSVTGFVNKGDAKNISVINTKTSKT